MALLSVIHSLVPCATEANGLLTADQLRAVVAQKRIEQKAEAARQEEAARTLMMASFERYCALRHATVCGVVADIQPALIAHEAAPAFAPARPYSQPLNLSLALCVVDALDRLEFGAYYIEQTGTLSVQSVGAGTYCRSFVVFGDEAITHRVYCLKQIGNLVYNMDLLQRYFTHLEDIADRPPKTSFWPFY